MKYKIGIDFGTTNSTVAFINQSNMPEAFRYPGPEGNEYIPSCVAYDDKGQIYIGKSALLEAGNADVVYCNNPKMILPMSDTDRSQYGWTKMKPPEVVITDFLQHILMHDDDDVGSFSSQKGEIEGVIVSVPHVWAKKMDHAGRSRLQSILANMKLPLIQLVSEPVAAAAYYAYQLQQSSGQSFTGNLLICDMGGGTFDVTLCTVEPGHVNELHNDGNGSTGLGTAGVFFDRALILENGKKVTDNSPAFFDLYNRLQDYKVHNHSNITKLLINAMEDPDQADSPVMRSGAISVNYRDIQKAFEKVEAGILDVLQRFKKSIDQAGYSVDAVFFVGGFAQFYLVREAIKKFWNIQQNGYRFIENINKEISRYAIAYGAALIANGMMSVEEKYIHTIGIEGYKLTKVQGKEDAYMQETVKMPIIEGGKKLSEYENIIFARNPVKAHHEYPEIVIYVNPESKRRFHSKKLPESLNIKLPGAGNSDQPWRVGMRINRSKIVYLVFEDMQGKRSPEYELGDLLRQMFGGLEVLD